LNFLFWVNPPPKRQQRLDVSFAARAATNAPGHEQQFARDQTSHSRLAPGESCASPEAAVGVASISSARVLVSRI
jgi:hypothetical protein